MGKYVLWLGEIENRDVSQVGSKAFELNKLTLSTLPVPKGFVITSDAYDLFLTQIHKRIQEQLFDLKLDNKLTIEQAATRIQKLILSSSIPGEVLQEAMQAYEKMNVDVNFGKHLQNFDFLKSGEKAQIAVRSSASSDKTENLDDHEFISFVNVKGVEQLRRAILACYASVFSTSNVIERLEKRLDYSKIKNPVLIQEMVRCDKSGTLNSSSSRDNAIEIRAVWGLGKTLEAFRGDIYYLDKSNNRILDVDVQRQDWGYYGVGKGKLLKQELSANRALQQKLDASSLISLGTLSNDLERKYGRSVSINFSFDEESYWITSMKLGEHLKEAPKPLYVPKMEEENQYGQGSSESEDWVEIPEAEAKQEVAETISETTETYEEPTVSEPVSEPEDVAYSELYDTEEVSEEPRLEVYGETEEPVDAEDAEFQTADTYEVEPEAPVFQETVMAEPEYEEVVEEVDSVSQEVEPEVSAPVETYETFETPEVSHDTVESVSDSIESESVPESYEGEEVEPELEAEVEQPVVPNQVEVAPVEESTQEAPQLDKQLFEQKLTQQLQRYSNLYPHARNALQDFAEEVQKIFNELS
jgi:hypothetical protein